MAVWKSRRPHRLLMWTSQSWRRVWVLRVRRRRRRRHHWRQEQIGMRLCVRRGCGTWRARTAPEYRHPLNAGFIRYIPFPTVLWTSRGANHFTQGSLNVGQIQSLFTPIVNTWLRRLPNHMPTGVPHAWYDNFGTFGSFEYSKDDT